MTTTEKEALREAIETLSDRMIEAATGQYWESYKFLSRQRFDTILQGVKAGIDTDELKEWTKDI